MVLFSDIPNNRMMRFLEDDGHCSVFRQPSMNSNGNTIDRQGRLITCEHSGRRVTRTELDGSITIIADSYNGKKLNSPNDVVVASDGAIWFTDPAYGIGGYYEGVKAQPEQEKHNVYRVDPKSGEIMVVVDDFVEPNGIAFSPDEKKLYIIDTGFTDGPQNPSHIRVFDVDVAVRKAVQQQSLRGNAQAQHYRRSALRHRGPRLVLLRLGRSEQRRRALLHARGRSARQNPHSGDGPQPVLRRPAAQQTLHLRLDIALCGLHKRAGRYEAMTSSEGINSDLIPLRAEISRLNISARRSIGRIDRRFAPSAVTARRLGLSLPLSPWRPAAYLSSSAKVGMRPFGVR